MNSQGKTFLLCLPAPVWDFIRMFQISLSQRAPGQKLDERADGLPVWVGELYSET